jgi:metal-responsive CopG/Arc/MetJ family transcriptional regulator
MAIKIKQPTKPKEDSKSVRASVSFPRELHETLERMAKEKKVSVAWIVRDATEKYIAEQWPLFDTKRER